jgi:hypothetical protein
MTTAQAGLSMSASRAYREKMFNLLANRDPLEVLAQTASTLADILGKHSATELRTRPFEGKWTRIWFSVRWGQIKVSNGANSEYRNQFRQVHVDRSHRIDAVFPNLIAKSYGISRQYSLPTNCDMRDEKSETRSWAGR